MVVKLTIGTAFRLACTPFVTEDYSNDRYVFLPDLKIANYAKATTALLDQLNIHFVPKELDPPNVEELRPIENVWALLKSDVYEEGLQTSCENQLRRKVRKCLRELDLTPVQRDFRPVKTWSRCYGDGGLAALQ